MILARGRFPASHHLRCILPGANPVSPAVLFPAMVPALPLLIGIPIVGEIPNAIQITGLLLVTVGLLGAIGMFRRGISASRRFFGARTS